MFLWAGYYECMEFGNNKYISKVVRLLETLIIVQFDIIVKKKLIRKI